MVTQAAEGQIPAKWDRGGLPAWTYHNDELTEIEKELLFRRHWQLACHVSDVPRPGDFITFDMAGERAIVVRGKDDRIRAFHNLCRHRGSRVLADEKGTCKHAIACPFHGWTYDLDGTLRGAPIPDGLPPLDSVEHGLKPIETEFWMGFVFVRFLPGDQRPISEVLARHDAEGSAYRSETMVPSYPKFWLQEVRANWKSVRDVDNEGYHVPMAHPALQDLYGKTYVDEPLIDGSSRSFGPFIDHPGRLWSVRHYKKILPEMTHLPEPNRRAWLYIGLFPNTVMVFYPGTVQFYQEYPISTGRTVQRGSNYHYAEESRELRLARYLAQRIDRYTTAEDTQLIEWCWEAMESSAFDDIILSDREYTVRCYHDLLRAKIPVMTLDRAPAANTVVAVNAELARDHANAAE